MRSLAAAALVVVAACEEHGAHPRAPLSTQPLEHVPEPLETAPASPRPPPLSLETPGVDCRYVSGATCLPTVGGACAAAHCAEDETCQPEDEAPTPAQVMCVTIPKAR